MNALLIDNDLKTLTELGNLLRRDGRFNSIWYCSEPAVALQQVRQQLPEVIFLATRFRSLTEASASFKADGITLANQIRRNFPVINLIFLATETSEAYAAFQSYPLAFLCKPLRIRRLRPVLDRLFLVTSQVGGCKENACGADALVNKVAAQMSGRNINESEDAADGVCKLYPIRCFGNYEISQPQSTNIKFKLPTRLSKDLLAFLIVNLDRTVSRDELMSCLLPKRTDARAVNLLHVNLYKLRRFLEQNRHILGDAAINECYRLRLPGGVCDLADYTRFVRNQIKLSEKTIKEAEFYAALWRGSCFAPENYPWSDDLQTELEVAQENLLLRIANYRWQQDEPRQSEAALKSLIQLNPLSEDGHCNLLDQYLQRQERRKYIREFEEYQKIMREELDINVDGHYQKAYQQLIYS